MVEGQRCAIVTGSSRGIGAAVAERLTAEGLAVVVNYAGRAEPADELVRKIQANGGTAMACRADVSVAAEVAAMFEAAKAAFGGVDVLVNNAGIMNLAPLAESSDDLVDRHLSINLKGTINTLREAARCLRDGGRIVNFSSSVVGLYQPTYGVYAATKAGVEALTHILAKELGPRGITVNAVAPGPTATALFLDGKPPELVDRIAKAAPLGRLGQPDDIAAVVAFLVGPDGGWVNGQVLRANGGAI
ncbi:SDR family oxidoreductase [Methylobacterium sp. J-078]|uniref:SDR family oxidoreductase n=1 Tax=Methylobacterium sp. J-078 TaxID=2836657 RepID=UPI001FB996DA|nr:SDR family oxidoreductase [Methylobacterium sp. J-078]MCJ2043526.1 SDR family oxidoreductase [Methylobacterium sp. J-078]